MIYHNMSFEDYQALDGLNASKLKPYLSSSKDGLYSEEKIWAASRALSMGTYIHARVLEGKTALDNFVTDGFPVNERTGKAYGPTSQKYLDWLATLGGKKVLTPEDAEIATATSRAVLQHDGAQVGGGLAGEPTERGWDRGPDLLSARAEPQGIFGA